MQNSNVFLGSSSCAGVVFLLKGPEKSHGIAASKRMYLIQLYMLCLQIHVPTHQVLRCLNSLCTSFDHGLRRSSSHLASTPSVRNSCANLLLHRCLLLRWMSRVYQVSANSANCPFGGQTNGSGSAILETYRQLPLGLEESPLIITPKSGQILGFKRKEHILHL